MADSLLDALQLPDSCRLGARITKKMLLENAKAMPADRKAIASDVESIVWQYTLKPSTIAIMPYADGEREYDEIALIEAALKSDRNARRVAELIHRAIPYPVVLALENGERQLLSLAMKRRSRSEQGATVADEFVTTSWLDLTSPSVPENAFIKSIALPNLPQSNYFALYTSLLARVIALNAACRTHDYHVVSDAEGLHLRRRLLDEVDDLEKRMAAARAALKKETQFSRKVELSNEIQRLEHRHGAVMRELMPSENGE